MARRFSLALVHALDRAGFHRVPPGPIAKLGLEIGAAEAGDKRRPRYFQPPRREILKVDIKFRLRMPRKIPTPDMLVSRLFSEARPSRPMLSMRPDSN